MKNLAIGLLFTLFLSGCGSSGDGAGAEPNTAPSISNLVLSLESESGCGALSFSVCSRTYTGSVDFTDSDGDLAVLSVDRSDTTITGLDGVKSGKFPFKYNEKNEIAFWGQCMSAYSITILVWI